MGLLSVPALRRLRRAPARSARRRPRVPVRLLVAVLILLLAALGGWLWLRDSSLVRVSHVEISGTSSNQGTEVAAALRRTAEGMSTLHVREADLRAAVADFASVGTIHARTDFPHTLRIEVVERRPVAEIDLDGERVGVGAGGRVLRGVRVTGAMPELHATRLPTGDRLTDPNALRAVAVFAAAPPALRPRVTRSLRGSKGLTLELRNGPLLVFGDATRPVAKWMAAARVLAEPSTAGALYLDLRVPERVAAGGLGTTTAATADPLAASPEGQQVDPQVQPEVTPTINP